MEQEMLEYCIYLIKTDDGRWLSKSIDFPVCFISDSSEESFEFIFQYIVKQIKYLADNELEIPAPTDYDTFSKLYEELCENYNDCVFEACIRINLI